MLKKGLFVIASLVLVAGTSFAKEVNVEDLEKKYWAPKEQKYSVVQSRPFTKEKKFHLSVTGGPVMFEPASKGYNAAVNLGYHFTERFGVELEYNHYMMEDNEVQVAIIDKNGFYNHGQADAFYGANFRLVPFYSKMSFFGRKIIYFDMSFAAQLGMLQYTPQFSATSGVAEETKTAIAFGLDISQNYYLTKKFAVRVDFKTRFHNQEIIDGSTTGAGTKEKDELRSLTNMNLGFTYFL